MINLPNSYERYLAALRIYVSYSIAKHGLQPRHLENLKKIYIAEALHHKSCDVIIDIEKLCTNLFKAVFHIKNDLKYCVSANGNYYANKKLLTCLLLTAAKTNNVKVTKMNGFLTIKLREAEVAAHLFVSALGGFLLKECKTNQNLAVIPMIPAPAPADGSERYWEYLFDKFSPVYLFFGEYE